MSSGNQSIKIDQWDVIVYDELSLIRMIDVKWKPIDEDGSMNCYWCIVDVYDAVVDWCKDKSLFSYHDW